MPEPKQNPIGYEVLKQIEKQPDDLKFLVSKIYDWSHTISLADHLGDVPWGQMSADIGYVDNNEIYIPETSFGHKPFNRYARLVIPIFAELPCFKSMHNLDEDCFTKNESEVYELCPACKSKAILKRYPEEFNHEHNN